MPNFFTDNKDIVFQFENLNLRQVVDIREHGYAEAQTYNYAPKNYEDAVDNFRKVLEICGDLAGNQIAPNAAAVDEEGSHLHDGRVVYAKGIQYALEQLTKAELMGVTLPRRFGGLNFPTTIYSMMIEIVSRADASLMNLFGLQDIGETINKFGDEDQRAEFLPLLASGEATGAMVLTEPDAGSDLQAVKLHAFQDEKGQWFLRGVKRFITNGGGRVLLVLARSEAGTKDGRGLSMFACYGDNSVVVRRIENKLGIHGSPTCELQFNDTPAQLIGKRKFGLIKYVMDLMNGARLGVSAQALGIAQAAYEEALSYAKAREQFGKPIIDIPAVTNIMMDMRVNLEANRSLLYATGQWVDTRDTLDERVEHLKAEGRSFAEEQEKLKEATRISGLLTPMTKYVLTESSNKITYDALQVHGGTGYMKEFQIERMTRDARITNIYEGTSQLQIVAATGGVYNDILASFFLEWGRKEYHGNLQRLATTMKEIRRIFLVSLKYINDKDDKVFHEVAAKDMVEMYAVLFTGYLLLDEAEKSPRKVFIANRFIVNGLAQAHRNAEAIRSELFADLLYANEVLI